MKASSLAENGKAPSQSTAMAKGAGKGAQRKVNGQALREQNRPASQVRKTHVSVLRRSDLAPSFIKRRDRRCRKCFSRRYASKPNAKAAKGTKK